MATSTNGKNASPETKSPEQATEALKQHLEALSMGNVPWAQDHPDMIQLGWSLLAEEAGQVLDHKQNRRFGKSLEKALRTGKSAGSWIQEVQQGKTHCENVNMWAHVIRPHFAPKAK